MSADSPQYRWWLDVETLSSWYEARQDDQAREKNVATVEGFVAGIRSFGPETYVGIYSNPGSWTPITGNGSAISATSPLRQLDTWRTSTSFYSYDGAVTTCALGGYNGLNGEVTMTQFVSVIDYDYSCPTGE